MLAPVLKTWCLAYVYALPMFFIIITIIIVVTNIIVMMTMMFEGVLLLAVASSARNHQTLVWDSLDGMRYNYCDDDDSDFLFG